MNTAVIAEKYLATGYRLVGVHSIPVKDIDEAVVRFREVFKKKQFDLILIQEDFIEKVKEEAKFLESTEITPIISVIPNFKGATKERILNLYELVSQAVGTKLKLEE